jgi:hypothetical protein
MGSRPPARRGSVHPQASCTDKCSQWGDEFCEKRAVFGPLRTLDPIGRGPTVGSRPRDRRGSVCRPVRSPTSVVSRNGRVVRSAPCYFRVIAHLGSDRRSDRGFPPSRPPWVRMPTAVGIAQQVLSAATVELLKGRCLPALRTFDPIEGPTVGSGPSRPPWVGSPAGFYTNKCSQWGDEFCRSEPCYFRAIGALPTISSPTSVVSRNGRVVRSAPCFRAIAHLGSDRRSDRGFPPLETAVGRCADRYGSQQVLSAATVEL